VKVLLQSSPNSLSEISLKIGQHLTKLRRTKQSVLVFWATLYILMFAMSHLKHSNWWSYKVCHTHNI